MAVIIGSARGDERGRASGGAAGDQKQTSKDDWKGEVSKQTWYKHSKGWVLIRAKDPAVREKIAKNMENACANSLIGYDQSQNRTLYKVAEPLGFDCAKVKTKCETDCAQLVRVCVRYAGIKCDDFYTASEKSVLKKTGAFDIFTDSNHTTKSDYLMRGDILVTKTKGHTVVVLSNGSKAGGEDSGGSGGNMSTVMQYQKFLKANYARILEAAGVGLLEVDGDYGDQTRAASVAVWKYMANKYFDADLTIGNGNFGHMCHSIAHKMGDKEIAAHPTLAMILEGVLNGRGYSSVADFQKAKGIEGSGAMNANTWYALFN